ncbi:unnamed protein product, partial [Closterium sp. NIES-53]
MAPGQQALAKGMAVEGAENEGEADFAKRVEEQEEGEEEAVEAVAVAEVVMQ